MLFVADNTAIQAELLTFLLTYRLAEPRQEPGSVSQLWGMTSGRGTLGEHVGRRQGGATPLAAGVAGWVTAGTVDARVGHPWLVSGPALATRLSLLTGTVVSSR